MKTWIQAALMLCALWLLGVPVATAEEAARGGGGLFSSILAWFGDGPPDADPERKEAGGDVTPSHVYQATLDLVAEIETLRRATGVADDPRSAEVEQDHSAIRAYVKSREVMEKTARFQRRLGMIPVDLGQIPVRAIAQRDVHGNVRAIIEELRRVKRQLVVREEIEAAPLAGGKTPALVYRNLWDASYLLDGLVGLPTTSDDVFANVLRVRDEMEQIAAALGVSLERDPPRTEGTRESTGVAQQVLRATYKAINLQSRLGMDPSLVPSPALERVTPAEVLDSTNILLAELARIRTHLDIRLPRAQHRASRGKSPSDVFAQVLLVIRNLDLMTGAAAGHAES